MKEEIYNRVVSALASIRPYLEADGGDVELIELTDDYKVRLELKGACKSCSMSTMTLKAGIEETIKRAVPEVLEVSAINSK